MGCGQSKPANWTPSEADLDSAVDVLQIPWIEKNYPPPEPPQKRKEDIFKVEDYALIDKRATETPRELAHSYSTLLEYLTVDLESDLEKLRSVFMWLGSQEIHEADFSKIVDFNTPLGYMKLMKARKGSYSAFFALLLRWVNIPCVIIYGVSKGFDYEVGDRDIYHLRNCWNAVYVEDSWRLIHPLWAFKKVKGFSKGRWTLHKDNTKKEKLLEKASEGTEIRAADDFYFLIEPEILICMCRPAVDMSAWQLLKTSRSFEQFVQAPFFRQRFFLYELELLSEPKCILQAKNGCVEIVFSGPEKSPMVFAHELFYDTRASFEELPSSIKLDRYVIMSTKQDKRIFFVRLPVCGIYKLRIYGGITRLFHLCDFRLDCDKTLSRCRPLPISSAIGFGFTQRARQSGLDYPSEYSGIVRIEAGHGKIFNFLMTKDIDVQTTVVHDTIPTEELRKGVKTKAKNRTISIYVSIPDQTLQEEYVMQVFTRSKGTRDQFRNAVNYLLAIDRRPDPLENPREWRMRLNLRDSSEQETIADFEHLIQSCDTFTSDESGFSDTSKTETTGSSIERRNVLVLERDLKAAIHRRQLQNLNKALEVAKHSEYTVHLDYLIKEGEEVRSQLRRLKRYLHHVLEIKQTTLSEIHKYQHPLPPIHATMMATYLLLREREHKLTDWRYLQSLMRRIGRESLIYRLMDFDIIHLDQYTVDRVQEIIKLYNEEMVQTCSAAAAIFYVWCQNIVIEAVISPTRNAFRRKSGISMRFPMQTSKIFPTDLTKQKSPDGSGAQGSSRDDEVAHTAKHSTGSETARIKTSVQLKKTSNPSHSTRSNER